MVVEVVRVVRGVALGIFVVVLLELVTTGQVSEDVLVLALGLLRDILLFGVSVVKINSSSSSIAGAAVVVGWVLAFFVEVVRAIVVSVTSSSSKSAEGTVTVVGVNLSALEVIGGLVFLTEVVCLIVEEEETGATGSVVVLGATVVVVGTRSTITVESP